MVKYAYMDARRYVSKRKSPGTQPLVIYGTRKIWDTEPWAAAMLWCKSQGRDVLDRLTDSIWPAFWRREVDAEDLQVLETFVSRAGADTNGFQSWIAPDGP